MKTVWMKTSWIMSCHQIKTEGGPQTINTVNLSGPQTDVLMTLSERFRGETSLYLTAKVK